MKQIRIAFIVAAAALSLAACSGCSTSPTQAQVVAIQNACAVDAGLRPSVMALEVFATPAEVTAINAARAIIDPICANPSGTPQANTISAVTAAVAQIVSIKTQIDARRVQTSVPAK